jgi:hypothetical protein
VQAGAAVSGSFTVVATLAANSTQFSHTGLDAKTQYCYRVQSFNAAGSSEWTSAVCVRTRPK